MENSQNCGISSIQDLVAEHEDDYIIESSEEEDMYEANLASLQGILDKIFKIYI